MNSPISDHALISPASNHLATRLGEEFVILNLTSGVYYGLDQVGARVWELMQTPQTFATIRDAIVKEFDVEPDQCSRDLFQLLRHMQSEGLIQIADTIAA